MIISTRVAVITPTSPLIVVCYLLWVGNVANQHSHSVEACDDEVSDPTVSQDRVLIGYDDELYSVLFPSLFKP